jgi:hypothetical protein
VQAAAATSAAVAAAAAAAATGRPPPASLRPSIAHLAADRCRFLHYSLHTPAACEGRYEKADFQRRVRDNFLALRKGEDARWSVVDADGTVEGVAAQVAAAAHAAIDKVGSSGGAPIARLWMDA